MNGGRGKIINDTMILMSHARRAPSNHVNFLGYGHEDTLARRRTSARRHGHGHVIFYMVGGTGIEPVTSGL